MEIFKDIPKFKNKICVSIGKFDGVHLGHVTLLEELVLISELKECESCVFTFSPYPEEYIAGKELLHISTKGEIISQMEEVGVDKLVVAKFDETFKNLSPEDFVKKILLDKLNASVIVCGSDVSFGQNGAGRADTLRELSAKYGFEVEIIDKIEYKGEVISSSRIVKAIENGDMVTASEMLGYDYYHYGPVIKGEGLGHRFDIPTVNIDPVKGRIIPGRGVYITCVETEDGEEFKAVTNVGVRPTVSDSGNVNIESHLIDCPKDKNLYGERIRVYFLQFIREEKKFANEKELFETIKGDITKARVFFDNN